MDATTAKAEDICPYAGILLTKGYLEGRQLLCGLLFWAARAFYCRRRAETRPCGEGSHGCLCFRGG
jgi:hypothetical protein